MKRNRLTVLLCALLAALLLCACSPPPEPEETHRPAAVTLWAAADGPLAGVIGELVGQYNALSPPVPVELRQFQDEESLADAMNSARPDLLLCKADHALALYGQGRLSAPGEDAGEVPVCLPAFRELSDCVGISYFPLGAEVQLLAVSPGAAGQTDPAVFADLESLCAAAAESGERSGTPYFAADSYAALFAACLAQTGGEFHAQRSEDVLSGDYRRVYNLLAGAAYTGGLGYDERDWLDELTGGSLGCLLASSVRLSPVRDGLRFYPMPVVPDGARLTLAEVTGVAVTSPFPDALPYAAQFLRWLCAPENSAAPLLAEGYLPAAGGVQAEEADSFAGAMAATAEGCRLYLPAADSGFRLRGEDFEQEFRAALALLK